VSSFGRDVLNRQLASLKSVVVDRVEGLSRARSAREGEGWVWLNRAIMGATMLRYDQESGVWDRRCGADGVDNTDLHCVSECSRTRNSRLRTGMTMYFASCKIKGIDEKKAYSNFVMGIDGKGEEVDVRTYKERGSCLKEIFESVMVGSLCLARDWFDWIFDRTDFELGWILCILIVYFCCNIIWFDLIYDAQV
jgi:hypothetical protein